MAERLEAAVRARGRDARTLVVRDLREARRWLDRRCGDVGALICVGGDSTLSEIARIALERRIPLVPVPVGFGNIFARVFGHRDEVPFVLDLLDRGRVRWVDVGSAGGEIFLSNYGFGLLEDVKQAVEDQSAIPRSGLLRYLAYVRVALRTLVTAPSPSVRVEADGELLAEEAPIAIVANVPTYRGFLTLAPEATPFDGLLDVVVVPPRRKPALVSLLLAFLFHLPWRWQGVCVRRVSRVSVEPREGPAVEIGVVPRALPVLGPPARGRQPEHGPGELALGVSRGGRPTRPSLNPPEGVLPARHR